MAMNKLELYVNANGHNSFLRNIPFHVDNISLAAGKPEKIVPPTGAGSVLFSCTGDYWVKANGTAGIGLHGSELNPQGYLLGSQFLSIVAEHDEKMSVTFYE